MTAAMFHNNLSTVEGWNNRVRRSTPEKPSESKASFKRMSPSAQADYNQRRLDFRKFTHVIETPRFRDAREQLEQIIRTELGADGAPPGMTLSGIGNTGKTTMLASLCAGYQRTVEKRDPAMVDRLPVLFLESPSTARASAVVDVVCEAVNFPDRGYSAEKRLIKVAEFLAEEGLQIMVWDEIQKMYPKTAGVEGDQITNVLRTFVNATGCILIGGGVNIEEKGIFRGVYSSSTATRLTRVTLKPFDWDVTKDTWDPDPEDFHFDTPPEGREAFRAVLKKMEDRLCLFDHRPGDLYNELAGYIHDRTGGKIGSVHHLIRAGADQAMVDAARNGVPERITRDSLLRVKMDEHSDQHYKMVLKEHPEKRIAPKRPAKTKRPKSAASVLDGLPAASGQ